MSYISIIEQTFFGNCRYWGNLHGSLYDTGPARAMTTGIESPDLNMAWNEKPLNVKDRQTIKNIKEYFQKAGLPFWWWLFPGAQSPETIDLLKEEGFSFLDGIPSMVADLTTLPEHNPCDTRMTVLRIENQGDLRLWKEVSFAGFDFPPYTLGQYDRFVGKFNFTLDSPQKYFLAMHNEKPVGTSMLFIHENNAGIYFVTTLAEERKKGIGLELTLATMRFAKTAGARYATLQSSPDGLNVYQQAGFQEYCRADVYSLNNT